MLAQIEGINIKPEWIMILYFVVSIDWDVMIIFCGQIDIHDYTYIDLFRATHSFDYLLKEDKILV